MGAIFQSFFFLIFSWLQILCFLLHHLEIHNVYLNWKDHYLQGIGLNNFTYMCNNDDRYRNSIKKYNCVSHPHNFYLQWLVETGIFGLLFFIVYLIFIFMFIYKKKQGHFTIIGLITGTIWIISQGGN